MGERTDKGYLAYGTDCCAMILEFHRRGLIQKEVLDDDMDVVSRSVTRNQWLSLIITSI